MSREARRLAEHHIGLAGIACRPSIAAERADDQIVEAVAIDVPAEETDQPPRSPRIRAEDAEALRRRSSARGRCWRSPPPCRTPHGSRRHLSRCRRRHGRPDDQVVEAVAIDVARRGDRVARPILTTSAPKMLKPCAVEASDRCRRSPWPSRTRHRLRRLDVAALSSARGPTIRSSKPSPLTSPAEETEWPA